MVLAMYSYGTVLLSNCGMSGVAYLWSELLRQRENTVRQRLREYLYDSKDKRGRQRHELEVETCFVRLLQWVVSWWTPHEKRMAIGLDATSLGQRFTVLSMSVLYRGCAIPVAWVILPANQKGEWMPHWQRLLKLMREGLPRDWMVVVLTDRGLYSKVLYQAIQRNHWHPMMRINSHGKCRPHHQRHFIHLRSLVSQPGMTWHGRLDCFASKTARLRCTLVAHWDEGFAEAWLLLTDLSPQRADSLWYGMRAWIEQGFKDLKRGGFRWEHTKMTDPRRAARLWLVIALATLWAVSVGGAVDATLSASGLLDLPNDPHPRRLSCLKRGLIKILAAAIRNLVLPFGRFIPELWPTISSLLVDPPIAPTGLSDAVY
jgi:hypothetical protein